MFDEKLKKYTISLIDFPIIVKPSQSKVGKKGISIINDKKDLQQGINLAKRYSDNNSLIIQEKIEGKDIVLLGVVKNNKKHQTHLKYRRYDIFSSMKYDASIFKLIK